MASQPCGLEPTRLGPRGEPRPLDDDHRPTVTNGDAELTRRLHEQAAQVGAERIGGRDVCRLRPVVEGVRAAARTVDVLVAHDERAALELARERTRGAGADDAADARLPERPHVRAEGDTVGRQFVVAAVAREESDARPRDLAHGKRRGRLPVRSVDLDLLDVLEKRVEAGATEDADHVEVK